MICKLFLHSPFISIKLYPLIYIIYIERVFRDRGKRGKPHVGSVFAGKGLENWGNLGENLMGRGFPCVFCLAPGAFRVHASLKNLLSPMETPEANANECAPYTRLISLYNIPQNLGLKQLGPRFIK